MPVKKKLLSQKLKKNPPLKMLKNDKGIGFNGAKYARILWCNV